MDSTYPRVRAIHLADWLVDHRVPISFVVFVALIVENIVRSRQPHVLTNWHDPWTVGGLTMLFVGLSIRSWAAGVLRKGVALATEGPYQLCRHPLYLGSWLMMTGFCALLNDPLYLLVLVSLVSIIYYLTIDREERRLAQRHGTSWTQYAARSSRLIPLRWPRSLAAPWSLAQWLRNREYKAVLTTAVALVAIHVWGRR